MLAFVASANAAAPQKYTYQFRGLGAQAGFAYYNNCGFSYVNVFVNQNAIHTDASGKPVTSAVGYIDWYTEDDCSYTSTLGYAFGDLTVSGNFQTLKASGELSGSASGQLSGGGYVSWPVIIGVNITVVATGNSTQRGENSYTFSSPFSWGQSRWTGTYADAALSGSITLGSSDLLSGLAPSYGSLFTSNEGSVTLYRL